MSILEEAGLPPARCSTVVPSSRRKRILIADHDVSARGMLADALCVHYEVIETADGLSALKTARLLLPALVIAEMSLPGIDGVKLTKLLRMHPLLERTPIVLVSGRTVEGDVTSALRSGARRYMYKPFLPETMLDVVSRMVDSPT